MRSAYANESPRFTPTCVGKSVQASLHDASRCPVHPHVCGEIVNDASSGSRMPRGSPPRVWGNLMIAGSDARAAPVHPHVCGEIACWPRAWPGRRRFTPTCVGKSPRHRTAMTCACGSPPRVWGNPYQRPRLAADASVHPHVCGEIMRSPANRDSRSVHPHVCGEICWLMLRYGGFQRFTPTCVGKSVRFRPC